MVTIRDHWGDRWTVWETRETDHGWPLHLGRPEYAGQRRGGKCVILTTELVEYLIAVRHNLGSCRLPVGGTVVKRLRKILGLNSYEDKRQWWEDHADELAELSGENFARKHGYSEARASQMHTAIFGRRLREPGWWREEPAASLLRGDSPRQEVAEALDVSVGTVGRLRWVLRQGQG
jgi:hypothetical protein